MPAYKSAPSPGMKVYNARNPQHMKAFKRYAQLDLIPEIEDRVLTAINRAAEQNPLYSWNIHYPDIDLKARVRQFLYDHFEEIVRKFYYYPTTHHTVAGYEGWYEFPNFGVLAFFTPDDGSPTSNPESDPLFRW